MVKNQLANAGDTGLIPGSGRPPGEGNGNPIAWEIPWTEESGGLQSMGSQRGGHDLVIKQQQHLVKNSLEIMCSSPLDLPQILVFIIQGH